MEIYKRIYINSGALNYEEFMEKFSKYEVKNHGVTVTSCINKKYDWAEYSFILSDSNGAELKLFLEVITPSVLKVEHISATGNCDFDVVSLSDYFDEKLLISFAAAIEENEGLMQITEKRYDFDDFEISEKLKPLFMRFIVNVNKDALLLSNQERHHWFDIIYLLQKEKSFLEINQLHRYFLDQKLPKSMVLELVSSYDLLTKFCLHLEI